MIKKTEILSKFKAIESEIALIEGSKPTVYKTATKYIPQIGYIHELETPKQLIKAQKTINFEKVGNAEAAKQLGLSDTDANDTTFMGFPIVVWENDIKNRLFEIRLKDRLEKLKRAHKVLKKNLSTKDKFALDMEDIDDVLSTVK